MSDSEDLGNVDDTVEPVVEDETKRDIRRYRFRGVVAFAVVAAICVIPVVAVFSLTTFNLNVSPSEADQLQFDKKEGLFFVFGSKVALFSSSARFEIGAPGYRPEQVELDKQNNVRTFNVRLEPLPGTVRIVVESPSEFHLLVDNEFIGSESPVDLELAQGVYELRLQGSDLRTVDEEIEVVGLGQLQRFEYLMETTKSTVLIRTVPEAASISVDGVIVGSGVYEGSIGAGVHLLTVSADGYETKTSRFQVYEDRQTDVGVIELEALDARLRVVTDIAHAVVLVDGEYVGETPLDTTLTPRQDYAITVRLTDHEPVSFSVTPEPGEYIEQRVALSKTQIRATVTSDLVAEVSVNGTPRGSTPREIDVRVGDTISVSKEGYQTQSVSVEAVTETNHRYAFTMMVPWEYAYSTADQDLSISKSLTLRKFRPVEFTAPIATEAMDRGVGSQVRSVQLTRPFYVSTTEVTIDDFSHFDASVAKQSVPADSPVTNLTWAEAAKFCNWMSAQTGFAPFYLFDSRGELQGIDETSLGFRLPTEAEWDAVAAFDFRSGRVRGPYPWGNGERVPPGVGNFAGQESLNVLSPVLSNHADDHKQIAAVGSYGANFNGMFDLAGNVSEWVHDFYSRGYIRSDEVMVDPLGPQSGIDHVTKGSNYRSHDVQQLQTTVRSFEPYKNESVGFRVARWIY